MSNYWQPWQYCNQCNVNQQNQVNCMNLKHNNTATEGGTFSRYFQKKEMDENPIPIAVIKPEIYFNDPDDIVNQYNSFTNSEVPNVLQRKTKRKKIKNEEKPKRKVKLKRFNGTTEEEIMKKTLPDHLDYNLDILIVGINPGLTAAHVGHHYAANANHFWKCMFLSGLTPRLMTAIEDYKMLQYGIGFTNIVERTTANASQISKNEIIDGGKRLIEKIKLFRPKIAAFNGKGIFQIFTGQKKVQLGKQLEHFPECPTTAMFVMPSTSPRFAQLPRAVDKVPFFEALKQFRDELLGVAEEINENFPLPKIVSKRRDKKKINKEQIIN